MFEAYTQSARRSFFIARQEAVAQGRGTVAVEHLLLGVLRAEPALAVRLFRTETRVDELRQRILVEGGGADEPPGEASPGELPPLSRYCRRVIAYASAEAENLSHASISPVHLLLGMARENTTMAARLLVESGVTIKQLEVEANDLNSQAAAKASPIEGLRNLVSEAQGHPAHVLIGRERELDQMIQILSRRTKRNPLLVGEAGVGKEAVVVGLAQCIADSNVPSDLLTRQIQQVDAADLANAFDQMSVNKPGHLQRLVEWSGAGAPILYVRGLFDFRKIMPLLAEKLSQGTLQIIATTSPVSYRLAIERNEELTRYFEPVSVLAQGEEEALLIVAAAKKEFEDFHGVVVSDEAVRVAVAASSRFLRPRSLADGALDLIDDAGTKVKLGRDAMPPDVAQVKIRLRRIVRQIEQAIFSHEFEMARKLSGEEKAERAQLESLTADLPEKRSNVVGGEQIIAAVAARASLSETAVKAALENPPEQELLSELRKQLSAGIPVGRRDWIEGLMAYLTDCSQADAERLAQTVQSVKARLESTAGSE